MKHTDIVNTAIMTKEAFKGRALLESVKGRATNAMGRGKELFTGSKVPSLNNRLDELAERAKLYIDGGYGVPAADLSNPVAQIQNAANQRQVTDAAKALLSEKRKVLATRLGLTTAGVAGSAGMGAALKD